MSQSVAKLKELLFAPESEAIASLSARIDGVFERAGTQERFQSSVATALEGALREVDVARHKEVASAIAPLIVRTVKSEITNSTDELVEALYPATGRMVRAYVASAIKDLSDEINRRLERNPVMAGLNALSTGYSAGDLAIADSQRLRVEDVFLIRRATGELVARWPQADPNSNFDHVMGGVLTAINEFTSEAFKGDGSALRQIDLGDRRVYLRVSPVYLLAAQCSGQAFGIAERAIDEEFLTLIGSHKAELIEATEATSGAVLGTPILQNLAHNLEARLLDVEPGNGLKRRGLSPLSMLSLLIGIPLIGWFVWNTYVDYRLAATESTASSQISAIGAMEGYPHTVKATHRGRNLTVAGLTPSPAIKEEVLAALHKSLPQVTIEDRMNAVIAGTVVPDQGPVLASLQRTFETRLTREHTREALSRAQASLQQTAAILAALPKVGADPKGTAVVEALGSQALTLSGALEPKEGEPIPPDAAQQLATLTAKLDALSALPSTSLSDVTPVPGRTTADALVADADRTLVSAKVYAQSRALEARFTADLEARLRALPQPQPPPPVAKITPLEELDRWVRSHAIFFTDNAAYRSEAEAMRSLDELADLMKRSGAFVRVVGYTDDAGTPAKNLSIAKMRSDSVTAALIARGVNANQLVALNRTTPETRVSPSNAPGNANRRVAFEVGFSGEGAQ